MSSAPIKIDKLSFDRKDGTKIEMTLEEAKELQEILNILFGKKIIKEVREEHHYHYPQWWYTPQQAPINPQMPWQIPVVYCNTSINELNVPMA